MALHRTCVPRSRLQGGDGDADIHARARTARQPQGEAEAIAVGDAGRHRDGQSLRQQLLALAVARLARLAPHFAAAAAARAGARHVDLERHHRAGAGLARGDRDLGARRHARAVGLDVIAAEEFDRGARRRKIDRDFVGKRAAIRALVRHERFERDVATSRIGGGETPCSHDRSATAGCQENAARAHWRCEWIR